MSSAKIEHYFHDGKNSCKNGKTGPGILVVEGKYKLRMNKCNKEPFIDTIVYSKGILSVGQG